MNFKIDKTWTLFLDRDGVINQKRDNDYVKNWAEFLFVKGSLNAISNLSKLFGRIIIVTNQRGVGKGLMKETDLITIHENMIKEIVLNNGKVDQIYFCTEVSEFSFFRKPNSGMGLKAKLDFPDIDFSKSIIVGDSESDIIFGQKLGMKKVLIGTSVGSLDLDGLYTSLFDFSNDLNN
jgi:histidinol-phosphate phosphatase family protein